VIPTRQIDDPRKRSLLPVAGCLAWYDASDRDTIVKDSNNRLFAWLDKSGNRNHLRGVESEVAAVQLPQHGTRSINALPAIDFFANAACYLLASVAKSLVDDSTCTWFVVASVDSLVGFQQMIGANANDGLLFRVNNTTGNLEADEQGFVIILNATGLTVSAGNEFQATCRLNSGASPGVELRLDGASATGAWSGAFTTIRTLRVGQAFDGLIGEIVGFSTSLSSGDVIAMEDYLSAKWGTP
jgi:hypothetical protein